MVEGKKTVNEHRELAKGSAERGNYCNSSKLTNALLNLGQTVVARSRNNLRTE